MKKMSLKDFERMRARERRELLCNILGAVAACVLMATLAVLAYLAV